MTTEIIGPHLLPLLYSKILLGDPGMWSPGVVTLSGHNRDENWDVQAAKGSAGASSKLGGRGIGQFQASFQLSADGSEELGFDDFSRWEIFQRLIESTTSGPTPVALPIYHPDLDLNGFSEVVSGGVGGLVRDGRGGAIVLVKFLEYRPPVPKPSAGARGGGGGGSSGWETQGEAYSPPDPNEDAKRELGDLLEEASGP